MTTLPPASSRLALWLVVAAVAVWLALNRDHLDPALIESAIHDLGLLAPLGHVVLFALGAILFVPGAIFGLLGGALWPSLGGGPQSHRRDLGCDGRIPRCALRRSGLGQTKGRWPARSPDRRGRGGGLAFRCLSPARAPLPVQPYQLRAWPHAHFLEALCPCIACLHGAGRGGLRLARPCRPRGRRRQHGRDPLRPDRPRAAGRNHVPATACAAPARRGAAQMDLRR